MFIFGYSLVSHARISSLEISIFKKAHKNSYKSISFLGRKPPVTRYAVRGRIFFIQINCLVAEPLATLSAARVKANARFETRKTKCEL
jgi:hypothetical protein